MTLQETISLNVKLALAEDLGNGDITAQLVPEDSTSEALIVAREAAVICGIPWVEEVFHQLDPGITLSWTVNEGDDIAAEQTVCELRGNSRHLLTGERTALNFLQTLSGTATIARQYASLVADTDIRILDTRKTLPGLRLAQKYAVKTGGCDNHRIGLYDAFLIKENHIAACGGIEEAVSRARIIAPGKPVEVEVENLEEFEQAMSAKAERVMLDNFSDTQIEAAIALREQYPDKHRMEIEISGNVTDAEIRRLKRLKVGFISTGALTKHCRAVDYSMRITEHPQN
ncbi:MAG TPA: carboxylating nicotinate-nucleotide diphosphorylase [Porticoccaceae bacterium]|nr:carboxylating nicotinate-nucleotide diphosphorylase [Porticoccaceae bacterium]HCO61132.1 carboxylating nicotinate-nucleotide diphosphorylase [Porticoccaceae bacterium]